MNAKSDLPLLILSALSRGANYGYEIAKEIEIRSSSVLALQEGTLYPLLHKLEQDGLIAAYVATVKGRRRRYYKLTEAGFLALDKERSSWLKYVQAVNAVLEGAQ